MAVTTADAYNDFSERTKRHNTDTEKGNATKDIVDLEEERQLYEVGLIYAKRTACSSSSSYIFMILAEL